MAVSVNVQRRQVNVSVGGQTAGGNTGKAVLYTPQILTEDQKAQARANIGVGAGVSFDPTAYGLPILALTGDTSAMTKENEVSLGYVYGDRSGTCTMKWQGSSSLSWEKKNYTIKFDNAFEAHEGWGAQKKYCLKANFIDHSHARNVVSAKLWGQVVKSRSPGNELIKDLVNGGAVDGFPIVITLNGKFHGLYTFNIPKDGWMFGMGSGGTVTQTENLAFDTYVSDMNGPTGEYTPTTSIGSFHIRKLSTISGGRCYVNWDVNKLTGFVLRGFLFDSNNVLRKTFCGHNGNVLNPYYGKVKGELGDGAWLDATGTRADSIEPSGAFSIPIPNGYSVLWYVELPYSKIQFPDGTLTKDWSSQAEANNTWVYTWVQTGINFEVIAEGEAKEAIFCADTTSEATRFQTTATLNGDFELEYANDEDNAEWALTSLNQLISACLNSNGTNLDTTIANYLDWDSAIDYYIFACLIGGADMAGKNYLLTTFDGTKWIFSAYDMDSTYGLWWDGKEFLRSNHYPTVGWYASYHKVMQLIRNHKLEAFKARYAELRNTVLSEDNVALAFENFVKDIPTPILVEDVKKWITIPSSSVNNVSQIRDWYRRRVAVIDKEVETL